MALYVTVADRPDMLAEAAATVLRSPVDDPFTTELVAVPSDGMRTWLTQQLAVRLGDDGAGIAANIDFVFPSTLVRRILAEAGGPETASSVDHYGVDRLTWAIRHLAGTGGPLVDELGLDVDLMRARSIADLFDRYSVHRSTMMRNWDKSLDLDALGRPLPDHHLWQPRLWRAVTGLIGQPSPVTEIDISLDRLRTGDLDPDVPPRLLVVGQSSFAERQLAVVLAAATRVDVHLLLPVWSVAVVERINELCAGHEFFTPLERSADPSVELCRQPLARSWATSARESHLLISQALVADGSVDRVALAGRPVGQPSTLLEALHADLRADRAAGGPDERFEFDPDDDSIAWYRCPGIARQAEVIRDVVRHLLSETVDGRPRYEPRDIAILSPDPARIAPFIEAACAGDGRLDPIPVRVADRSLGHDSPLMEVVGRLLELCEGRFRLSEVLDLAAHEPVARRFGFTPETLGRITEWAVSTHVAWGLDAAGRREFGIPEEITTHTWTAGIEQLFVGAALADPTLAPRGLEPSLGPGETVATGALEGEEVDILGDLVEFIASIGEGVGRLSATTTPDRWAADLADLVHSITEVDDPWHRRRFERLLDDLVAASAGLTDRPVDGGELARLVLGSIGHAPGRVRFGTGALTVSSLTAQRGVPHRVIFLVGLDGDLGSTVQRADDLMAMAPCVGDRDPRHEVRSQLLDAVLAAGERLVITSDGVNVVTSADIPPVVALAEFADVLDTVARSSDGRPVSQCITVDHPRHRWSKDNFIPGALGRRGPWSHDRRALDAARHGVDRAPWMSRATAVDDADPPTVITAEDLAAALEKPIEAFARQRLGASMIADEEVPDDQLPLSVSGLAGFELRRQLLDRRRALGGVWSPEDAAAWAITVQRSGAVPPLHFGTAAVEAAIEESHEVFELFRRQCPELVGRSGIEVTMRVPITGSGHDTSDRSVECRIEQLHDSTIVDLQASRINLRRQLSAWIRLLVLAVADPATEPRVIAVGFDNGKAVAQELTLDEPENAADDLAHLVELYDRARRQPIPAPATTSRAIVDSTDRWAAQRSWNDERDDPWIRLILGTLDYSDVLDIALDDEQGDTGAAIAWWAEQLWSRFDGSLVITEGAPASDEART